MAKLSKPWHKTGLCTGLLLLLVVGWASANSLLVQQVAPEDLLPANSFFYLQVDGQQIHQEAYKQTAEYKAFTESGLAAIFKELGETITAQNSQNSPLDMQKMTELFSDGFVLSASLPQGEGLPIPSITIVAPNAGRAQAELLKLAMTSGENIEVKEIEGRNVATFLIPNSPGIEIGMWAEGKHLVVTAGPNSIANTIACATGEAPSISSNEKWEQVNSAELDFDQISLFWLDWKALQNTYGGIPIPVPLPLAEPLTVSTILELLGIDKLDQLISRSGYKGEAIWSETNLVGMTNKNGTTMTLKDLPPLPKVINYFSAFQCDPSGAYDHLIKLAQDSAAIAGPQAQSQVDAILGILPQMIGFDPKADLLDHLGNTVCVYDDPNGGYLGTGTVVCISLDDAEAVKGFISGQLDRLENYEAAGGQIHMPVYPFRVDKNDGSLVVFDIEVSRGITLQYGAIQVIDNWLVISVMPQAVEAFYLRTQNKLATWKPNQEQQTALNELPDEFTALTVMDTRKTFRVLLNLATPFLPAIQAAAFQSGLIG
ncbi:MAG: hypothetical protein JKY95_01280, partial [Planctomycetaceae bacterium]|nr:hypothetical protein [Planctomycetaceae bacterium]